MIDEIFNLNLSQYESTKVIQFSHSISNSSVFTLFFSLQLSLVNDLYCSTTATACQVPGKDTESNITNIDNWLQQVTRKNGEKQKGKKHSTTRQGQNSTVTWKRS